ncbi:MAG: class F sortase [Actinomycetia bacterium]|nr:class F sortase [Actinomycetes bacterium]MCP3912925.1 class F sortase [Actinomycetes bacterium]MCP4084047.1 class F sortase [Actinomycetes bacterium]
MEYPKVAVARAALSVAFLGTTIAALAVTGESGAPARFVAEPPASGSTDPAPETETAFVPAARVTVVDGGEPPVLSPHPPQPSDNTLTTGEQAVPLGVRIPGIDVDASIIELGLNGDGSLEVPSDYGLTGWYTGRAVPGDIGPSVVVGHVDSTTGPAVFNRLPRLEVGDLIEIDRSDGLVAHFRVSEITLVQKDQFPTAAVYGATEVPALRLITCGGAFDREERSYGANHIVYAEHLGNEPHVS